MAYDGYLIKVGNYTIPTKKFIRAESYKVTRSVSDLDSYRDANGLLHRNALQHILGKVEFETPPMLTNEDMAELFGNIRANFTKPIERKATVTVYFPETDDYFTSEMYMADTQFTMYGNYGNKIQYSSVRLAFISY